LIHVAGLSKNFGPVRALDRISFHVGEGEIHGFLGPNGAGKTTALRILTGFMPADGGTATVAGYDVRTHSLKARSLIGYLPEGVPLYPEMRVREYLNFRARLKGIRLSRRSAAVTGALDQAGVREVEKRIVGTLSRGYRQRVGLADAVLGDPPILILDEPTVGLDPEQVRQFRLLLKKMGETRTVIFSTHILSEVEQVADRVSIIVRGKIAASDTTENLRGRLGALDRIHVEMACDQGLGSAEMARELQGIPGVERVQVAEPSKGSPSGEFTRFAIQPRQGIDPRTAVFELARNRGWILRELARAPLSLEEIFLEVISGESRESGEGGEGGRR